MNQLAWMHDAIESHGFVVPESLKEIIEAGEQERGPFYFVESDHSARLSELHSKYLSELYGSTPEPHRVLNLAQRGDYDGIICLILAGGTYARGQVVVFDWDGSPPSRAEFASLDEWAKEAEAEIAYYAATDDEEPSSDPLSTACDRKEMNPLAWMRTAISACGFEIPPDLESIVERAVQLQYPFYFYKIKQGARLSDLVRKTRQDQIVIALAMRPDYDGLVCLITGEGAYKRGSVAVFETYGRPGTFEEYPSLADWAKAANTDITECIAKQASTPPNLETA